MKLQVFAVGKLKSPGLRGLCDDYLTRIRRYTPIDEHELKEDAALKKALLKAKAGGTTLITLQVAGQALSSTQLARQIDRFKSEGRKCLVFVIGGPEGIAKDVDAMADLRFSLSALTLPHRLARLILLEQLYRAFSMLNNEPYARED